MLSSDEAYARLAAEYDTMDNPVTALGRRQIERIGPELAGNDVLDLGCGTGSVARHAARFEPRSWVGLDRVAEMIQLADIPVVRGDFEHLPFTPGSFDVALFWIALGYVMSPVKALAEARNVLRPSGRVFILDLHPIGRKRGWTRGFGSIQIRSVIHSRRTWLRAFREAGLRLEREDSIRIDEAARGAIESAGRSFREFEGLETLTFFELRR